jgi:hypothetical protein
LLKKPFVMLSAAKHLHSRRLAQSAALRPTDGPIPHEKLDAAVSAAGEELQLSGRKMAFAGGYAQS